MATNLSSHNPITMWETISGNTPFTQNPPEAAGQTFKIGSPIELSGGYAQVWDGNTLYTNPNLFGVAQDFGHNLGTAGQGYPPNFGQIGFPGSNISILTPPNQPDAVTIPYGAPFITGGVLTLVAVQDTLFIAQTDTSEPQTTITAGVVALSGGVYVLTATASNVHYVGEYVVLSGFTGDGLPLNGLTAQVLTVPSDASYTAQLPASYTGGAIAATGAGDDNPGPVTPTIASVGKQYGLTVDANGTWYIDFNKTTNGNNTAVQVIGLYPGDVLQNNAFVEVPNGQLIFQFLAAVVSV